MEPSSSPPDSPQQPPPGEAKPPPRAFTQGVGTVYQVAGVMLFLVMMSICCGSGLMSMETAKRTDLANIGWHLLGRDGPMYSVQKAISSSLTVAVGLGVALATVGLGLQGMRRHSPAGALLVSGFGTAFWLFHAVFFAFMLGPDVLVLVCLGLFVMFATLLVMAIHAWREMRADPPPPDLTILPPGYKVPYSHMHEESPEVRFEAEMQQRRQRLEVQQKELDALEERIRNNKYKRGEK